MPSLRLGGALPALAMEEGGTTRLGEDGGRIIGSRESAGWRHAFSPVTAKYEALNNEKNINND